MECLPERLEWTLLLSLKKLKNGLLRTLTNISLGLQWKSSNLLVGEPENSAPRRGEDNDVD